jgi:hypothetical protein
MMLLWQRRALEATLAVRVEELRQTEAAVRERDVKATALEAQTQEQQVGMGSSQWGWCVGG